MPVAIPLKKPSNSYAIVHGVWGMGGRWTQSMKCPGGHLGTGTYQGEGCLCRSRSCSSSPLPPFPNKRPHLHQPESHWKARPEEGVCWGHGCYGKGLSLSPRPPPSQAEAGSLPSFSPNSDSRQITHRPSTKPPSWAISSNPVAFSRRPFQS